MKLIYDKETDALSIILRPGKVAESVNGVEGVNGVASFYWGRKWCRFKWHSVSLHFIGGGLATPRRRGKSLQARRRSSDLNHFRSFGLSQGVVQKGRAERCGWANAARHAAKGMQPGRTQALA